MVLVDCSVVKSTFALARNLDLIPSTPWCLITIPNTSYRGSDALFQTLQAPSLIHVVHIQQYRQSMHNECMNESLYI